MSDAVDRHGVRHVVVDNLQFMLGSKSTHLADCYTAQNHAIAEFRKFASNRDVHISLVVHPRKVICQHGDLIGSAVKTRRCLYCSLNYHCFFRKQKTVLFLMRLYLEQPRRVKRLTIYSFYSLHQANQSHFR